MDGQGGSSTHSFTSVSQSIICTAPHFDMSITDVLDGAMVTLAIYTFNFTHPGPRLGSEHGKRLSSDTGLVPEPLKNEHV